ncbi:protein kinase [Ordospora pajunii]|uniref:protein kinase n=1 Tax=Ordospora pajunii TaxID=3039483 RepID=UPI0029526F08|nr:protein kinase [Ordospora pajunii]KAH9411140.1 protein kinase [Ordospora pajunii]
MHENEQADECKPVECGDADGSSEFKYCRKCTKRIALADEDCWRCVFCTQRFHERCKYMICDACSIEIAIRRQMMWCAPPLIQQDDSPKISIEDFEIIRVLGRGSFGKVVLAKHSDYEEPLAIKILRKEKFVNTKDLMFLEVERNVLRKVSLSSNPFLISMKFWFQDAENVFLVMEYLSGGDLLHHVMNNSFCKEQIKQYASEVLLAIEFLHKEGIIFRDLKLENIMLSGDGHIKLVDFGLCKENIGPFGTTFTYCGTLDTLAPEVIAGEGYTKDSDWWSYGVVLYELYEKDPPFHGSTNGEICSSIMNASHCYDRIDDGMVRALIDRLLEKNPAKRIGHGEADANDIKAHEYFHGVDWESVVNKRAKPLFIPGDLESNFDTELSKESTILRGSTAGKKNR